MKTIKEGTAGKLRLRLVDTGKDLAGVIFENNKPIFQNRGTDAETLWSELQRRLTREGPDWFGYDGARSRLLHWFPGGFTRDQLPAFLALRNMVEDRLTSTDTANFAPSQSRAQELATLAALRSDGHLTDDEFTAEKAKLLAR
jgi:hypothetical protein